jgi:hypothetical protein
VLVFDLEPVEQHGERGRASPPRRHRAAPRRRVDHDGDAEPHQVLPAGHQGEAVERLERPQEEGVADRPGRVGLGPQGVADVDERIGEPQRARIAEGRDRAQDRPGRERDGERPMTADERACPRAQVTRHARDLRVRRGG